MIRRTRYHMARRDKRWWAMAVEGDPITGREVLSGPYETASACNRACEILNNPVRDRSFKWNTKD